MSRPKSFFTSFTALFAFLFLFLGLPFSSALAQSSSIHGSGYVEINVLDQDGNEIGGNWYLHEGQGPEGLVVRNGTLGETFKVNYGYYFLRGERKAGYGSFEVTSENPQESIPSGTIAFTLVYQKETPYTSDESNVERAPLEESLPVTEGEPEVSVEEETPLEELLDEEDVTPRVPDRSVLPERTPLRVEPPATSLETAETVVSEAEADEESVGVGGPVSLAVTGPESLLALLALSGMGGAFSCFRRRRV